MKRGGDEGQATVELALVLPVVALLLLLVVQTGLVVRDQVLVVHAAREAARHAAVDPRAGVALAAARRASSLKAARLTAETSHTEGSPVMVTVRLTYRATTDLPLVGALLPDVVLHGNAAMRDESGHNVG